MQRELKGFFNGENDGILIPKVFENKKGTQFAKRMVLGFVQDALRADSETEWSCHSRILSIKRTMAGFVQDALRADSEKQSEAVIPRSK